MWGGGADSAAPRRAAAGRRAHWDAVAASLSDLSAARSTACYQRCERALIARAAGSLAGATVLKLDLWNEAVNTRLLQWLEDQGARTFGVDLSAVTTERARRNFVRDGYRPRFAEADIVALPFAAARFDLVYTMGTIEHIAEYEQALAEIHRVLKPGGLAIIGVPYRWDPFLRPLIAWLLQRLDRYPYSPERSFSATHLRALVARSGLRVVSHTGLMILPGALRMLDLVCHLRRHPLERLTGALVAPFEAAELRWAWPRRFGYMLTVMARKDGPRAVPSPHRA